MLKKIGSAPKNRVGRVTGNAGVFWHKLTTFVLHLHDYYLGSNAINSTIPTI